MSAKILIVDDDESIQSLLETRARSLGYTSRSVGLAEEMRRALLDEEFQAVLLDLKLPDGDGIALLREVREAEPELPVIMITGHGNVNHAVDAMRAGAYDFCQKPIDLNRLSVSLKNALERYALKKQIRTYQQMNRESLGELIGGSAAMQVVYRIIETVGPTNVPVFIHGESGTGKELAARAIHRLSPRKEKNLIDVNCSAIPKDLMESQLFGHEPYAFTGAQERNIGQIERAHGSTLFLDEVAEMDINLQAKLLRVLQEYSFFRVGGKEKIRVDVRVISATNREPLQAIRENRLREDLFYRLKVVELRMPPLREHIEDVPDLADFFLKKYNREMLREIEILGDSAMDALCAYSWPGNVRELENVIRQAVALNPDAKTLQADMLPEAVLENAPEAITGDAGEDRSKRLESEIVPIEKLERQAIEKALRIMRGNVGKASAALHLSQATLYRKLRDYGLVLESFKG